MMMRVIAYGFPVSCNFFSVKLWSARALVSSPAELSGWSAIVMARNSSMVSKGL